MPVTLQELDSALCGFYGKDDVIDQLITVARLQSRQMQGVAFELLGIAFLFAYKVQYRSQHLRQTRLNLAMQFTKTLKQIAAVSEVSRNVQAYVADLGFQATVKEAIEEGWNAYDFKPLPFSAEVNNMSRNHSYSNNARVELYHGAWVSNPDCVPLYGGWGVQDGSSGNRVEGNVRFKSVHGAIFGGNE